MKAYEYWITDSLAEFKREKTINKVNVLHIVKIVYYNSNVLFQTNRILYKKLYFDEGTRGSLFFSFKKLSCEELEKLRRGIYYWGNENESILL